MQILTLYKTAGVREDAGGFCFHFAPPLTVQDLNAMMRSREPEKKSALETGSLSRAEGGTAPPEVSADTLAAFYHRLRDRDAKYGPRSGRTRLEVLADQSEQVVALADEFGILKQPKLTCAEWRVLEPDLRCGTEHMAEFSEENRRWGKITIPPAFGLIPRVVRLPVVDLRQDLNDSAFRRSIEFSHATPLEYLERCRAANEIFHDDIRLESVVVWADDRISFGISQPAYHGQNAVPEEIEEYFVEDLWTPVRDPSGVGHVIFYNYAFEVLAIDVEPRNCFINSGLLLPFDVILCRPDEDLETFLELYPS